MEEKASPNIRRSRSKAEILRLLLEFSRSGQSIKDFCAMQNISRATFYRWKGKYNISSSTTDKAGTATLQIAPKPDLFAAVGNIMIYRPVSAAYLKALVSRS